MAAATAARSPICIARVTPAPADMSTWAYSSATICCSGTFVEPTTIRPVAPRPP